MELPQQITAQCECGLITESFRQVFVSDKGDFVFMWDCEQCQTPCLYVVEVFEVTDTDENFLKSINVIWEDQ